MVPKVKANPKEKEEVEKARAVKEQNNVIAAAPTATCRRIAPCCTKNAMGAEK